MEVKIVLVGDAGVGKTSQLITFHTNTFPESYIPTVYDTYTIQRSVDDSPLSLSLWDTAAQEDYDILRPLSYPGTNIFLVEFAINDRNSFDNVRNKWVPEIQHHAPGTPWLLVGNKGDLRHSAECVMPLYEATELANELGALGYFECSALTADGLDTVFTAAARFALSASPGDDAFNTGEFDFQRPASFTPLQALLPSENDPVLEKFREYSVKEGIVHVAVSAGEFAVARSGIELRLVHDATEAQSVRGLAKESVAAASSLVVSFGFSVKSTVDAFALGELSGVVSAALALARSGMPANALPPWRFTTRLDGGSGGVRVYRVTFVLDVGSEPVDVANRIAALHHVRTGRMTLEFSQGSQDVDTSECLKGRMSLDIAAGRSLLIALQRLGNLANKPPLFQVGKRLSVEMDFDSIDEVVAQVASEEFKVINFGTLRDLVRAPLAQMLSPETDTPKVVRETYEKVLEFLSGPYDIQTALGDVAMVLTFRDMPLFELLPTLRELQQ